MNIAIAGASGHFGRAAADRLLEVVEPSNLVLVTRTPAKLAAYAERGVSVRYGDFDQPATLSDAFAGVDRLILVSTSDIGRRVPQHIAAIEAARTAGVRHIAYTSSLNPSAENPAFVIPEHRATEDALRASGVAWTILRNSLYAESEAGNLLNAVASGQPLVHNYGQGAGSFVSRMDCAAAAAAVVSSDGHEGRTYDVTGPAALTADEMAAIASEATGRPIQAVAVDDATYASALVEHAGLPAEFATSVATFGRAVREGYFGAVSTDVQQLTGRPATPFRDVLAATLAASAA